MHARKNLFSVLAVTLLALTHLAGCGMIKNMDEMHDNTAEMNEGMKEQLRISAELNAQTSELGEVSKNMKEMMAEFEKISNSLYMDHRQGDSLLIRGERLKLLAEMEEMATKISEAGQYLMGFEFQLYKHSGFDDELKLDDMYLDAVRQFFRDLPRFSHEETRIDLEADPKNEGSPAKKKAAHDMLNLFALAAALGEVNPNQKALARAEGYTPASMLTLLEGTLAIQDRIERGEVAPKPYQTEILLNRGAAVYLLQLRANFLSGMILEFITGIKKANLLKKAAMVAFVYDVNLDERINVELETYDFWLKEAVRQRDFLVRLGHDPRIDWKVKRLYKNMMLRTPVVSSARDERERLFMSAKKSLFKTIKRFNEGNK